MRGLRIALGLVGVFGLAATAAAEPSIYGGGGVGLYDVKIDSGSGLNLNGGHFQDGGSVWRVLAGYQFGRFTDSKWMPNLAIQADYVWYGTTQDHIPKGVTGNNVKLTGDGWEASLRPSWAITNWFDVYARVGYQWYNASVKPQYIKGQSDSNNELMYAGGVGFHFTPNFGVTAEYEVVNVSNGDLSLSTLNFVYSIPR